MPVNGSLEPDHVQLWLKRFRERLSPRRIRYFLVGEYGGTSRRPHYHLACFGVGCGLGPIRVGPRGERTCQCQTCSDVRGSWDFGHIMVGELTDRSAAYIAGYVLKKMSDTQATISGLHPEFARMSLRPGIGAGAIPDVASVVMQYKLEDRGDVPVGLRHGSSVMPFGRYLRRRLREQCGLDPACPDHVIEAIRQGLLPVFEYADAVLPHPTMARFKKEVVKQAFWEINEQVSRNAVASSKIRRGSI